MYRPLILAILQQPTLFSTSVSAEAELAQLIENQENGANIHPPMTQQSKVSFAEGTAFERERTAGCKEIKID